MSHLRQTIEVKVLLLFQTQMRDLLMAFPAYLTFDFSNGEIIWLPTSFELSVDRMQILGPLNLDFKFQGLKVSLSLTPFCTLSILKWWNVNKETAKNGSVHFDT